MSRIRDKLRIPHDLRAARHKAIRQLRSTHIGPLGRAISLKAVEFIPEVYNSPAHNTLRHIARGIEFACKNTGRDVDAGVMAGFAPTAGIGATSDDFFSAGAAFFGSLVSFTDRLAGLLVRTMAFGEDQNGDWIDIDDEACLKRISEDEELRAKWERFFLYGAGIFFDIDEQLQTLSNRQRAAAVQLTSAMEVFILGHEYCYHMAKAREESDVLLASGQTAFQREFEADEAAGVLSKFLGVRGFAGDMTKHRNTWMESGAGAAAVICAAECVKYTHQILQTGAYLENTLARPSGSERLTAIENWSCFAEDSLAPRFRDQRRFMWRVIPGICNSLKTRFCAAHQRGYRSTSVQELRERSLSKIGRVDAGLVEILTRSMHDAGHRYERSDQGKAEAEAEAEATIRLLDAQASEDTVIARDLLKQHQDRSIRRLAETALIDATGISDPGITAVIAEKLRHGRIDGQINDFELLLRGYADWIEQICAKLKLLS